MAIEIEHKYLVIDDSYKHTAYEQLEIRQGYLNRQPEHTVRIRTVNDRGFLTVKGKNTGDVRHEYEYEIPLKDALEMLSICEPGILEKTRYKVKFDNLIWEIDEYHGSHKGLVVAEVEIPEPGYRYSLPSFIGKNVTGDPCYYNSQL
ncbi:MAG: CYTH domain-containing protein [Bacteroides sp.]|nr:CYTH domain-containing protein [Bacteroides sp.]